MTGFVPPIAGMLILRRGDDEPGSSRGGRLGNARRAGRHRVARCWTSRLKGQWPTNAVDGDYWVELAPKHLAATREMLSSGRGDGTIFADVKTHGLLLRVRKSAMASGMRARATTIPERRSPRMLESQLRRKVSMRVIRGPYDRMAARFLCGQAHDAFYWSVWRISGQKSHPELHRVQLNGGSFDHIGDQGKPHPPPPVCRCHG